MEIRKTKIVDLDAVMKVYAAAREFMKLTGNPNQWGNHNPPQTKIENDIKQGNSYVCEDNGEIIGAFTYIYGEDDPTYGYIENGQWLNDEPYGVMHSVASAVSGKGIGAFCIDWALKNCGNVRIDTHADNKVMQALLNKKGFSPCGTIYLENGDPRLAFHKTLKQQK